MGHRLTSYCAARNRRTVGAHGHAPAASLALTTQPLIPMSVEQQCWQEPPQFTTPPLSRAGNRGLGMRAIGAASGGTASGLQQFASRDFPNDLDAAFDLFIFGEGEGESHGVVVAIADETSVAGKNIDATLARLHR